MAGLYDLLAEGKIERSMSNNCVEFLINDSSLFSKQGINTLRNERHSGLIKCGGSRRNGKQCIRYYILGYGFKPLSSVLDKMNAQNFIQCMVNLKSVFDIPGFDKHDGFFNKNNVAIDFSDVYVDTASSRVYILYVPLIDESADIDNSCERLLGEAILRAVKFNYNLSGKETSRLCELISNGIPSFRAIGEVAVRYNIRPVEYEMVSNVTVVEENPLSAKQSSYPASETSPGDIDIRLKLMEQQEVIREDVPKQSFWAQPGAQHGSVPNPAPPQGYQTPQPYQYQPPQPPQPPQSQPYVPQPYVVPQPQTPVNDGTEILGHRSSGLYLVSKRLRAEFELHTGVNCIGRNCDINIDLGVMGNATISHHHAVITVEADGRMFIQDSNSKNKTYIISSGIMGQTKLVQLNPNKTYPIAPGTVIRFANEDFTIVKK